MNIFGIGRPRKASSYFDCTAVVLRDKYEILQSRFQSMFSIPVSFSYAHGCGGGVTKDVLLKGVDICIYNNIMCDFIENLDDTGESEFLHVPGHIVVADVVAMCHETEHARQIEKAHDPEADPFHAMRYLVDIRNPFLYDMGGSRYWNNTSEIESERRGVLDAGRELHRMFPNVEPATCTRAVEEYVQSRCYIQTREGMVNLDYFIKASQGAKIAEVRRLFDDAARRQSSFCYSGNVMGALPQKDEFLQTVYLRDKKSPWWEVMERLNSAETERESTEIVYAISLMSHPEDMQNYTSLKKAEAQLQPDVVFGKGFLEKVSAYDRQRGADSFYLRRMDSMTSDIKDRGWHQVSMDRELPEIDYDSHYKIDLDLLRQ